MPSQPPSSDTLGWTVQVLDHLGGIIAFIAGMSSTAAFAIWRLARWANRIEDRLDEQDKAAQAAIAENERQHASVINKIDELKADLRRDLDRFETITHGLTIRIDALKDRSSS